MSINMNMNDIYNYFRVYDKVNKRYGLPVYTVNAGDGITKIVPPVSSSDDQFVIEQSSGKFDKNNKMIFENDILESKDWKGNVYIHVVKHYQGNMVLFDEKGNVDGLLWNGYNYEIISNIHNEEK